MKWLVIIGFALAIGGCNPKPYLGSDRYYDRAQLPLDEAPHHKNSLEWWYFTGHLYSLDSSLRYGTEFVFFHTTPRGKKDYLILNFALSDPQADTFYYHYAFYPQNELLNQSLPLELTGGEEAYLRGQMGHYQWGAEIKDAAISLDIRTEAGKGLLLHDGTGYEAYDTLARAGYYSYPRLAAEGRLIKDGDSLLLRGELWYDRQWNCGAIWSQNLGWDWFSVQFEDSREELMLYQLNDLEGDSVRLRGGTWFGESGEEVELSSKDISLQPLKYWRSPETGALYPIEWEARIAKLDLRLTIQAEIAAQELELRYWPVVKVAYWEGMCKAAGQMGSRPIRGNAYLEMTRR